MKDISLEWYNKSYKEFGIDAQRKYPNEELLRFLAREFSLKMEFNARKNIKILELGCGTCANLWAVGKEGFDAYGIDFSEKAIQIGKEVLKRWNVKANIIVGDFRKLPYENDFFDCVFDILSTLTQVEDDFLHCINEVYRILKPGGLYFSFFPSANSDAFIDYEPSKLIEDFTIDGIRRETSAYFSCIHPFRFLYPEMYKNILKKRNFKVKSIETITRTYRNMKERFETISIVGEKNRTSN